MPFNIEIISGSTPIKIQVVKKVINIYFNGEVREGDLVRQKWTQLELNFVPNFPEFEAEVGVSLTDGIFHRKKEHTNSNERKIIHSHATFLREVTPELFSRYLNHFYFQQVQYKNKKGYHFFKNPEEVNTIIEAFSEYYKNYKGSSIEEQYEFDTELTPDEKNEHEAQIKKPKGAKMKELAQLLTLMSIFDPARMRPSLESIINDEDDCRIM
jgi:hypothetical protein